MRVQRRRERDRVGMLTPTIISTLDQTHRFILNTVYELPIGKNLRGAPGRILGGWEIVLILAVVLILFGAKKLPELAKGLGTGIKEFKKATREVTDELNVAMEDNSPPRPKSLTPTNPEPHPEPQPIVSQSAPGTKA